MIKTCQLVKVKSTSLNPLEKGRTSVNMFGLSVLDRLPGISANCWNAMDMKCPTIVRQMSLKIVGHFMSAAFQQLAPSPGSRIRMNTY
ncbi:hypothetical protein EUZ87_11335 [Lactiplantibacillus paraplantarum]|uniref:Uncharacterized protein n=1 Tax=Lactiplantibacillus paraplantarum TaxID=60520 RepID=A0A4Q9XZU0_9LACO|nr:hypothetical protein EUZ87_11335 [Lactiplantibacillus paraplantarum]